MSEYAKNTEQNNKFKWDYFCELILIVFFFSRRAHRNKTKLFKMTTDKCTDDHTEKKHSIFYVLVFQLILNK